MFLYDLIDRSTLDKHIAEGYVTDRPHREYGMSILNYSDKCQFDNVWDDVTVNCRGLVYDTFTKEILARPFPKFFNWDHGMRGYPPSGPVLRMEKMDGSLGILVPIKQVKWNGGDPKEFTTDHVIATRGSFHSDQAAWATKHFHDFMDLADFENKRVPQFKDNRTYLFEIIYPGNRIVVDYGDFEGLVLLDVIDNETGFSDTDEFDDIYWPDKVVRHPLPEFNSGQVVDIPDGEEGFVYLWPTRNYRTKMKSAQYLELHKIVTGLNEKTVWKAMCEGKSARAICDNLPDEFHGFVQDTYVKIEGEASAIVNEAYRLYVDVMSGFKPETFDRAQFAKAVDALKVGHMAKYLFAALDGRDLYMIALKSVKPKIEPVLSKE
jgi:RNA ligase